MNDGLTDGRVKNSTPFATRNVGYDKKNHTHKNYSILSVYLVTAIVMLDDYSK